MPERGWKVKWKESGPNPDGTPGPVPGVKLTWGRGGGGGPLQNSLDFNPAPFITLPRGVRMCQPTTRHIIHSPGLLAVATEIHTRYGCVCFLRRLEPALHLVGAQSFLNECGLTSFTLGGEPAKD